MLKRKFSVWFIALCHLLLTVSVYEMNVMIVAWFFVDSEKFCEGNFTIARQVRKTGDQAGVPLLDKIPSANYTFHRKGILPRLKIGEYEYEETHIRP